MTGLRAYILAGGRNSRFGSDKARAEVAGQPVLQIQARLLAPVCDRVTVVADLAGKYADLGLRTIADVTPGLGPLGGLATALADVPAGQWFLLTACDHLTLPVAWLHTLTAAVQPEAPIVAFRREGRWEPLLALYHASLQAQVAAQLASGQRAMQRLLDTVPTVALEPPADWHRLLRFNTPEELQVAVANSTAVGQQLDPGGHQDHGEQAADGAQR